MFSWFAWILLLENQFWSSYLLSNLSQLGMKTVDMLKCWVSPILQKKKSSIYANPLSWKILFKQSIPWYFLMMKMISQKDLMGDYMKWKVSKIYNKIKNIWAIEFNITWMENPQKRNIVSMKVISLEYGWSYLFMRRIL